MYILRLALVDGFNKKSLVYTKTAGDAGSNPAGAMRGNYENTNKYKSPNWKYSYCAR